MICILAIIGMREEISWLFYRKMGILSSDLILAQVSKTRRTRGWSFGEETITRSIKLDTASSSHTLSVIGYERQLMGMGVVISCLFYRKIGIWSPDLIRAQC